jgi:hypothetical protein
MNTNLRLAATFFVCRSRPFDRGGNEIHERAARGIIEQVGTEETENRAFRLSLNLPGGSQPGLRRL